LLAEVIDAVIAGRHWHTKYTSDMSIDPTSLISAQDVANRFRSPVSLSVIFVFTQVFLQAGCSLVNEKITVNSNNDKLY